MQTIQIYPRISEKAYTHSEKLNVYVFMVSVDANKLQIKKAVQDTYDVTVTNVRTLVQDGKKARSIRLKKRSKYLLGKRSDTKKAYVTLKAGDEIPVFAEMNEAEGDQ